MAALIEIVERNAFRHLMSPTSFSAEAMIAAAWAEIDIRTGTFVTEKFRERLEAAMDVA